MADIHDTVAAGRLSSLRRHLADGGDSNARTTLSRTLLHMAAEHGRTAMVTMLLEHGAEIDARDYRKHTPLHIAAGVGAAAVVACLLDAGADPRALDTFGEMPLHHAASRGGGKAKAAEHLMILERLVRAGCPIDAPGNVGRTPLIYAASTGTLPEPPAVMKTRLAIVKWLLDHGADPTIACNTHPPHTALDGAHGRHQSKPHARAWPEAIALLEASLARAAEGFSNKTPVSRRGTKAKRKPWRIGSSAVT